MQYKLVQLIDCLYDEGLNKEDIIAICNLLKNEQQIDSLMLWIKEKPILIINELKKKAKEISENV